MRYTYLPRGVCSRRMDVSLEGGTIREVEITGGCHGNLQAVSRLVRGMDARRAIELLEGIRCGYKDTSCPDQLAKALKEALAREAESPSGN